MMKPYMLIEGSSLSIESFEQKIAAALGMGYILAGDLISHPVSGNELKFYQPVILEDEDEDYDDEDEENEEDEDYLV